MTYNSITKVASTSRERPLKVDAYAGAALIVYMRAYKSTLGLQKFTKNVTIAGFYGTNSYAAFDITTNVRTRQVISCFQTVCARRNTDLLIAWDDSGNMIGSKEKSEKFDKSFNISSGLCLKKKRRRIAYDNSRNGIGLLKADARGKWNRVRRCGFCSALF